MPKPKKVKPTATSKGKSGSNNISPRQNTQDDNTNSKMQQRHKTRYTNNDNKYTEDRKTYDTDSEHESDTITTSPNVPGHVVSKLIAFSILMLLVPIFVYFSTLKFVFSGSTTPSAIAAVISANFVLAAYVYVAWIEDVDETEKKTN